MGQPRRRTREHAPAAGIGSLRRAAAQHPSSPPRTRRSGAAPPTEEAAAWLPAAHPCTGRSIPRCRSPPPNGQPQPPTKSWAARRLPPGRGKPTWGIVKVIVLRRFWGRNGLSPSATPPPPSSPKRLLAPTRSRLFQGHTGGEDSPRRRHLALGALMLRRGAVPHRTRRTPSHGPQCPGALVPSSPMGGPFRAASRIRMWWKCCI